MTTQFTPAGPDMAGHDFSWPKMPPSFKSLKSAGASPPANDRSATQSTEDKTTMAMTTAMSRRSSSKFKRAESIEFRTIFVVAFAVFLVAAVCERLLPTRWFKNAGTSENRQTVFAQAKAAANTCAAYAFMG